MKSYNSIFKSVLLLSSCFALTSCMLDNMEKITESTRDEVKATNDAIHQTENMQKIARMHSLWVDPTMSPSVRANAAKAVMAKYPENLLAADLGMLVPTFRMGSIKRKIGGTEVELLNVPYVGNKVSRVLRVAPVDPALYEAGLTGAATLLAELEAKSKSPGISSDEMATYREAAARLVVIVPALLAAANLAPLENNVKALIGKVMTKAIEPGTFLEQLQTSARGFERATPGEVVADVLPLVEQLAVNVSLDEAAIAEMRALISVRLGIN